MSSISTHVLDAVTGTPASGVAVSLLAADGAAWRELATAATDADGRVGRLLDGMTPGIYRIVFDTDAYFTAQHLTAFYPEVVITFRVDDERHYHVPTLLSPYAYSTYRGS